jgi:hypothetical protein
MPPHYAPGAPESGGQGPDGRPGQNGPADTYPYSGTSPYTGLNANREPVHGGVYAYVIRDDEFEGRPAGPQPTPAQVPAPGRGSQQVRQSRTAPLSLAPAPPPAPVASGVGVQGETGEAPSPDPAVAYGPDDPAYGPDDPAYGPPGRDWYERAEEARRQEAEAELRQARGAFEPLPPDHEITAPARPDIPGQGTAADQPAVFPDQIPGPGDHGDHPSDDDLDVGLVGQGAVPLERIKDLYVTAEAIGERRLDKHFDQLLARQRQLISDYFTNQEFRGSAGAGPSAASPGAVRGVPGPGVPGPGVPSPGASGDRLDGAGEAAGRAAPDSERLSGTRRSPR